MNLIGKLYQAIFSRNVPGRKLWCNMSSPVRHLVRREDDLPALLIRRKAVYLQVEKTHCCVYLCSQIGLEIVFRENDVKPY